MHLPLEILNCNIARIETKKIINKQYHRGAYKTFHTSKTKCFTKIVNDWKALISSAKGPVLDVWQGSKYASIIWNVLVINRLIIYISLLHWCPKCWSYEGKLFLQTILLGIYYSPTSIHIYKDHMLAETACSNISIILQQT